MPEYADVGAAAAVEAIALLLVGGRLDIQSASGAVLSSHDITGSTTPTGRSTWLAVAPAIATGTGSPAGYTARAADGRVVVTGSGVTLPDIEDGADVLIDSFRLEA